MVVDSDLLHDQVSFAMLVLNREGNILYANAATTKLTGYTAQQLLQQNIAVVLAQPDDTLRVDYQLALTRKTGELTTEGWIYPKNSQRLWGEIIFKTMPAADDQEGLLLCTIQDRNDKKTIELELRRSEERFKIMVESVREYAIYMMDPNGYILTWNDGATSIKGYPSAEIIGKHFTLFYTPQDNQQGLPKQELRTTLEKGKFEGEGWRVKRDGSVFWAGFVLTPLYNDQGLHIGFSKVTRDLTEKKYHEESLRQSEEKFRLLVEQVTDYGIFMMDEKGIITSWNQGARNIKGYTAEEIIGRHFSSFYPEEDIISGKPAMELKIARENGKYEEEGWRIRKNKSRFWASVIITAVYNNGVLVGFSKVTRDLTERKLGEQELALSKERYRKLAEELSETNRILSEVNSELEQFTSIVSHDLQEPIRTIKSYLTLIHQEINSSNSEKLRLYLEKSIASTTRMRELIQNLLHYSQLSKAEISREPLDVESIFNDVSQNLKALVDERKATIKYEIEEKSVFGNRIQLGQLFQNLISNALKFNVSAHPQIMVRSYSSNGLAQFSVQDNGIGIAEKDREKIFDIFKRLNSDKMFPGMGIGLAVCKKIAEQHHGSIHVESVPGTGATFYVSLGRENSQVL